MKTAVFTIGSKNYFAYVKTLMQSLEVSNPQMDRYAVVVDELDEEFTSIPMNFGLLTLDELKLPNPNCFKFRYDIMEFNTAVKPYAILRLFADYDRVVYLDPDIYVYEKLQPVEEALDGGDNFVFTPHFNDIFEEDGCNPNYSDIMQAGTYNLGFVALNKCDDTIRMVTWWANILEKKCINDQRKGIFVDQKWMDLVPGFFEHIKILRDAGLNVAYWNLSHRTITKENKKFFVNGRPLIFYHFSGLDVDNIDIVSKHQNRFLLKDIGDGGELFERYSEKVLSNDFDVWKRFKYSYGSYADGRPVLSEHRQKYRSSKMLQGYCGDNPFLYADIFYGDKQMEPQKGGVNLLGYMCSEHGVGEAVRLTANCLTDSDVSWTGIDFEVGNPSRKKDAMYKNKIEDYVKYNISILNVNADQFPVLKDNTPKELWDTYKIGIWYWELSEFPWKWMRAFLNVDEIWAPTKFIYDCLKKCAPCPVYHMPPGIYREPVDKTIYTRAYFDLPEKAFLFLNMFDVYSFSERKNPEAAVKAFQQAFSAKDMSVGLVLKLNNSGYSDKDSEKLKRIIKDYKNIYIIAETLSREAVNGLLTVCDVAVSLHRSEGLGLLCEEAMFYGKPVIATAWSGNMDFMTQDSACLVKYEMINVGKDTGVYEAWQKWADPDVGQAADYMKRLANDRDYYTAISVSAQEYIRDSFSPKICGKRMKERLREISDMLKNGYQSDKSKATQTMANVCVACFEEIMGTRMPQEERKKLASSWCRDGVVDFDRVADMILESAWAKNASNKDFILGMYTKLLDRVPEEKEISRWINSELITDRRQVVLNFLKSDEFLRDYAQIYGEILGSSPVNKFCGEEGDVMKKELQRVNRLYNVAETSFGITSGDILSQIQTLNNTMAEELHQANLHHSFYGHQAEIGQEIEEIVCKQIEALILPVIRWQEEYNAHVVRYLNDLQNKVSFYDKSAQALLEQTRYNAHITRYLNEAQKKIQTCENVSLDLKQLYREAIYKTDKVEKRGDEITGSLTEIKEQISNVDLNVRNCLETESSNIKQHIDLSSNEIKNCANALSKGIGECISVGNTQLQISSTENRNTIIEVEGSRHNQVVHYLTEILSNHNAGRSEHSDEAIKKIIHEKWAFVDEYERRSYQNHKLTCPICGDIFETDRASRLVSECIFNGGRIIRYVCPKCGVTFGPEKMLNLSDELFANDYKMHYSVYSEGDSTQREIQVFRQLEPKKEGIYLDWGVGAWSSVISTLREEGYQVYGYDPYAPVESEYIITSEDKLKTMKFDGIFSHDLLEHLKDPVGTFRIFSEILRPNGRMIHATACYDYVYEYTRFHLFFYTGTSIEEICRRTGFVVEDIDRDSINLEIKYSYRKV